MQKITWVVLFITLIISYACEDPGPVLEVPEDTSIEVRLLQSVSEGVCLGDPVRLEIIMKSKDRIGLQSLRILKENNTILQFNSLDPVHELEYIYETLEEDLDEGVLLEFELTDDNGTIVSDTEGFLVVEDMQYISWPFSFTGGFNLKHNESVDPDDPMADISIVSYTESCGNNCTRYRHDITALHGVKMYSFPEDFNYNVDNRNTKASRLHDEMQALEPLETVIAYTALESDLMENELYISNSPLVLLIGEKEDVVLFQIADPAGLWRYKKKSETSGQ